MEHKTKLQDEVDLKCKLFKWKHESDCEKWHGCDLQPVPFTCQTLNIMSTGEMPTYHYCRNAASFFSVQCALPDVAMTNTCFKLFLYQSTFIALSLIKLGGDRLHSIGKITLHWIAFWKTQIFVCMCASSFIPSVILLLNQRWMLCHLRKQHKRAPTLKDLIAFLTEGSFLTSSWLEKSEVSCCPEYESWLLDHITRDLLSLIFWKTSLILLKYTACEIVANCGLGWGVGPKCSWCLWEKASTET